MAGDVANAFNSLLSPLDLSKSDHEGGHSCLRVDVGLYHPLKSENKYGWKESGWGFFLGIFYGFFLVFFMVFRSADARVSQSVKQLVSQLVDSRPSGQSVGEPTERSVSQSVGQPTERPVSQSVSGQR